MFKKIKKHKILCIVIAIILIVVIVGAVIFSKARASVKNVGNFQINQSTVTLEKTTLSNSISATGTIESSKTKTVTTDINGVEIKKVKVAVGDSVSKGDVLVTFDEEDLEEALEEAKENLAETTNDADDEIESAEEQLSDAKDKYNKEKKKQAQNVSDAKSELNTAKSNVKTLKKKIKSEKDTATKSNLNEQLSKAQEALKQAQSAYDNALSNQETTNEQNESSIENAQKSVESATKNKTKQVKEAQKQVDAAQENLDKCAVTAPMDGVITAVYVEEGDTYKGSEMFRIDDTSSYMVTTTVDEYDISSVEVGQKVVILTDATDEEELEGEITFVSLTKGSSSASQTGMSSGSSDGYEVEIAIKTTDDRLRMGLTAKCSIVLEEATDIFAVPYDAVHEKEDGTKVVYVMDSSSDSNISAKEGKTQENMGEISENMERPDDVAEMGERPMKDNSDNSDKTASSNYKEVQVTTGMETDYYIEISGDELTEGMKIIVPTDEVDVSDSGDESENSFEMPFGGGSGQGSNFGQGAGMGGNSGRGGAPAMGGPGN